MGKDIRKFIEDQGGIMPEKLPTPAKSLKQIPKERKNVLTKISKKSPIFYKWSDELIAD